MTEPGPDFFDDAYVRVLAPFHTEVEARREVAGLRELLPLAQSDRVLDLGCGWGRHLALLRAAGHDVVGVDLSPALLRQAAGRLEARPDPPGRGGEAGQAGRDGRTHVSPLAAADMQALPLRDSAFDVVLNLATSLGLFLDDEPAVRSLREARRVLRPGGRVLLEGMHREDVESAFAPRDRWMLDDGTEVRVRRRWDPDRGVSHEVLAWEGPDGDGRKRHSLRIRSAAEMTELLEAADLRVRERYADWGGAPFTPEADRLIVIAGRE